MLDIDMLAVVAFFVVVVEAELCTVCAVVVAEAGLIAVGSMVVVAAALEVAEQILAEQI